MDNRAAPRWWDHQRHSLVRLRREISRALATIASQHIGGLLVDMGCGRQPYRPIVEDFGFRYVGCDITADAPVAIVPGCPVPLDGASATVVTSIQVLEHVWDLDWYLGECRRLLHPTGRLLLSTHGSWLYHPHPTDYRRWTRDGLVREIEAHGFRVASITGLMGPLAWTTQFRLLGYREALLRIPLVGPLCVFPLALAMNVRMEIEDAITPDWIVQTNACTYVVVAEPIPSELRPSGNE